MGAGLQNKELRRRSVDFAAYDSALNNDVKVLCWEEFPALCDSFGGKICSGQR